MKRKFRKYESVVSRSHSFEFHNTSPKGTDRDSFDSEGFGDGTVHNLFPPKLELHAAFQI